MKLSREGAARLGRHEARGFPVSDFEFRPEDFKGCFQNGKDHIALTVDEAGILTRCAANEFCRLILEHGPVDLAREVEVLMYDLAKRIEQAEKSNE